QENGRLPPISCRQRGAGGDVARGDPGAELAQVANLERERAGPLRRRTNGGRRGRGPPGRGGGGYTGGGEEGGHGILCRAGDPRPEDGEPDRRSADRPQRPRRSVVRHIRALP